MQVLEGTWEEITREADRFAGRQVRVTVLDDASAPLSAEEEERLLDELAARHAHLPPLTEDAFSRDGIYREHD